MKAILLLFVLTCVRFSLADGFKLTDTLGVGCLVYNKETDRAHYIPKEGFTTFNENGEKSGCLKQGDLVNYAITDKRLKAYTVRTDHDFFNLIIMEEQSDLLRLRVHQESVWISKKEIVSKGFAFFHWDDLLYERRNSWIYAPYSVPRTLFSKPDTTSSVVADISGANINILEKGENGWVKVKSYQGGTCGEEISDEYTGWIRLISDKGTPLYWIAVDGC